MAIEKVDLLIKKCDFPYLGLYYGNIRYWVLGGVWKVAI